MAKLAVVTQNTAKIMQNIFLNAISSPKIAEISDLPCKLSSILMTLKMRQIIKSKI
jgi:hypothetical protein